MKRLQTTSYVPDAKNAPKFTTTAATSIRFHMLAGGSQIVRVGTPSGTNGGAVASPGDPSAGGSVMPWCGWRRTGSWAATAR